MFFPVSVAKQSVGKSYMDELGMSSLLKNVREQGQQPSMLNMMGGAIQQFQAPVKRYMKYDLVRPNVGQAKYKPTPINKKTGKVELPANHKSLVKASPTKPQASTSAASEYTPTPLSVLKQRATDSPEPGSSQYKTYDPLMNYSTSSQPKPAQRITLGSAGKDFSLKRQGSIAQSKDEIKRPKLSEEGEAKFSSDDEDQTKPMSVSEPSSNLKNNEAPENSNASKQDKTDTQEDMDISEAKDIEEKTKDKLEINGTDGNMLKKSLSKEPSSSIEKDIFKQGLCECPTSDKLSTDEKCKFCKTESQPQKIEQKRESSGSEKGDPTKSNGKDSEKENSNRKSHSSHKSSKHSRHEKHSHSRSSSSKHRDRDREKEKEKSSSSSKSKSSRSSSSSHKHKSKDKERRSSTSKSSKSSKSSSSKSSKSSSHSSSKSSSKLSSKSSSSSLSSSRKTEGKSQTDNIFDAFSEPKAAKIQRKLSNVELFGNDSDSETKSPVKPVVNSQFSDSSSDDSDFIEISSLSSENSVKDALLREEDFKFEDVDPYDECLSIFKENQDNAKKQQVGNSISA